MKHTDEFDNDFHISYELVDHLYSIFPNCIPETKTVDVADVYRTQGKLAVIRYLEHLLPR